MRTVKCLVGFDRNADPQKDEVLEVLWGDDVEADLAGTKRCYATNKCRLFWAEIQIGEELKLNQGGKS